MQVDYDRIARYETPSTLRIRFTPAAVRHGQIKLWVSDSLVTELGTQRVIPQPTTSTLDHGGILYTFPAARVPDSIEFALEPKQPGIFRFGLRFSGSDLLSVGRGSHPRAAHDRPDPVRHPGKGWGHQHHQSVAARLGRRFAEE